MSEKRTAAFTTISELSRRSDDDATRALVALTEDEDEAIALEAARALLPRSLPPSLGERIDSTNIGESVAHWLYACAAKAILDDAPDRAYARLAPHLEPRAIETSLGRIRAEQILGQLEKRLAASWRSRVVPPPDPRFLAVCESLGELGSYVHTAFVVMAGGEPDPSPRNIELGEDDDPPFPFLIAGFALPSRDAPRVAHAAPNLCFFRHQYGGLACLHDTFLGFAVVPPPTVVASERVRRLRDACWDPYGEAFTEPELREWSEAFEGFPSFERGAEAMLVSRECDPISVLRGLDVLAFGTNEPPWRRWVDLTLTPDVTPSGVYGDAHDAALAALGLGLGRPRIIYLWGNSD